MALAVDITDGRGLSNKAHRELLPKKSKGMLYLPFVTRLKVFNQLYITNKTERFSFKSGRAMRVAKLIFRLKAKSSITKILEYKAVLNRIKFVSITMCSLVMSLCS